MSVLWNVLALSWLSTPALRAEQARLSAVQAAARQVGGHAASAVHTERTMAERIDRRLAKVSEELRLRDFEAAQLARNVWTTYLLSRRYCLDTISDNDAGKLPPDRGALLPSWQLGMRAMNPCAAL